MGKVISIERQRTLRLALEIEREFRRSGARELRVKASYFDDVGRWRRAAVIAVHRLGHPATTWASRHRRWTSASPATPGSPIPRSTPPAPRPGLLAPITQFCGDPRPSERCRGTAVAG